MRTEVPIPRCWQHFTRLTQSDSVSISSPVSGDLYFSLLLTDDTQPLEKYRTRPFQQSRRGPKHSDLRRGRPPNDDTHKRGMSEKQAVRAETVQPRLQPHRPSTSQSPSFICKHILRSAIACVVPADRSDGSITCCAEN